MLVSDRQQVPVPEISFYKYISDILGKHNEAVALIDAASGSQLTFKAILHGSRKLASALTKRGLQKQEVVALSISNCIEYPLIILGITACNAIVTTCNPHYTLEETLKQFENCQPKFVITDSDQVDKVLEIATVVTSIQEVICMEINRRCMSLWTIIHQDDGLSFPSNVAVDVHQDVAILPYSSGTTGLPKGVMLTHYNMVAMLRIVSSLGKLSPSMRAYSIVPMFHGYGLLRIFLLLDGVLQVIDKRFQVESFFKAVEKYKIKVFFAVPAVLQEVSNSPLFTKYDLSSLSLLGSGASPLPSKVKKVTESKLRAPIVQSWGLTECMVISTLRKSESASKGVGHVVPNTVLKVVDQVTRKELGAHQDGELLVKGPLVMKGYYKKPDATAATFEDGWLCTGDVGHYDENGMIFIVDRMKELIKYKGFQVAPAELESLLSNHPKVKDVGVVGIPDASAGEVPRAFIVKADPSLTESEVHQFVESRVSRYKYLRGGAYFLDEIPRNATGKILRTKLSKLRVKDSKLSKL